MSRPNATDATDVEVAIAAAEAGSAVVRRMYGEPLARFAKSPTDFATEADVEAERMILEVIRTERPDDAFLGEEGGHCGPDDADRTWLVDPLCGTLNFAVTTPLVAVNVALRADGVVRVAASADPLADEVFWTDGTTSGLRRHGVDHPLGPSAASRLVDVNLDAVDPDPAGFRPAALLGVPEFRERYGGRVLSTTLALAWVADGRRAAYVTDGDLRDNVHFASAIALCTAAGCVLTDLRGDAVGCAGGSGLIAAADEETHQHLLRMVAGLRP